MLVNLKASEHNLKEAGMRRWLRYVLSILAVSGFGACLVLTQTTSGTAFYVLFAAALISLGLFWSLIAGHDSAQKVEKSYRSRRASRLLLPGNSLVKKRLIVCLPGMGNSGEIVFAQHTEMLRRYGDVMIIDYPEKGFDGEGVIQSIYDHVIVKNLIQLSYPEVIIIGQSMGVPIGIALMSQLMLVPEFTRTKFYFVSVSGFVTRAAVRSKNMLWVFDAVRDFWGSSWLWPKVLKRQFRLEDVDYEMHSADADTIKSHYRFLRSVPYVTTAAQGRYIDSLRHQAAFFAPGMVPCLHIETAGLDVLLNKDVARGEIQATFDATSVAIRHSRGIHANLVECPHDLGEKIGFWLDHELAESPTAS